MPTIDVLSAYRTRRKNEPAQPCIADPFWIPHFDRRHECLEGEFIVAQPVLRRSCSTPNQRLRIDVRILSRRPLDDDEPDIGVELPPGLDTDAVGLGTRRR